MISKYEIEAYLSTKSIIDEEVKKQITDIVKWSQESEDPMYPSKLGYFKGWWYEEDEMSVSFETRYCSEWDVECYVVPWDIWHGATKESIIEWRNRIAAAKRAWEEEESFLIEQEEKERQMALYEELKEKYEK